MIDCFNDISALLNEQGKCYSKSESLLMISYEDLFVLLFLNAIWITAILFYGLGILLLPIVSWFYKKATQNYEL